ncbi:MAG: protein phosphatase 2C domain-containing protein [Acidimicrobiia bacterium]|nr:protein phosphatase 2C domain-containing protein [Acidimicrobiia bacterium]
MDVQGLGRTDRGVLRSGNEDAFVIDVDLGLYAVCDGVGGHAAGEVASAIAIGAIERLVREHADLMARVERDPGCAAELQALAADAVRQACRDVYDRASADKSLAGMGCTATVLLVAGAKAVMAHVGDTRLYVVRSGEAHQLSSDHTLAADLVRQKAITIEEMRDHPHSHVLTRALGAQPSVEVEALSFDLVGGDRLVLCSDGFSDYLPSPTWLADRVSRVAVEDLPDHLVDFAIACGGRDNITVLAVAVEGLADEPSPTQPVALPLDILRSSFLFADLTLAQLTRVLDRCQTRDHHDGEIVRTVGDIHDELLVVSRGSLRVVAPDGRRIDLGVGQHLGEALVLRPRSIRSTIVASEPASVLALNRSSLLDLSNRRPWLGVSLLTRLVERLSVDRSGPPDAGSQRTATALDLL